MQPEKTVCRSRSDRTEHGTKDWFNIGKGMHQGYILLPAYLTYTQSTSCKMPGWMKHKLGSRLPEKMAITSDMQMTPVLWRRGTKEHLDEGESEE